MNQAQTSKEKPRRQESDRPSDDQEQVLELARALGRVIGRALQTDSGNDTPSPPSATAKVSANSTNRKTRYT